MLGGGHIGAELSQAFARAGVAVTLVCRSRLLPEAEPEIGAALAGYLAEEGTHGAAVEIRPGVFRPDWSVVTAAAAALLTAKAAIAGAADWP